MKNQQAGRERHETAKEQGQTHPMSGSQRWKPR